jgi:Ca2+-binding RTX toxin-like protein
VPIIQVGPNTFMARCACLLVAALALGTTAFARSAEGQVSMWARTAEASHLGWPTITGMLLQNSNNENRPLDGRPGYDPFDGTDPSYSCDGVDTGGLYHDCGYPGISDGPRFTTLPQLEAECRQDGSSSSETDQTPLFPSVTLPEGLPSFCAHKYEETDLVPADIGHNELLGGDGNDTIHAGPAGDVIWGDSHAEGNDTTQVDRLYGGAGDDWIYASHGTNYIWTGAGEDHVLLVYGHGVVYCNGPGHKILVMRKLATNRHYRLVGCTDKTVVPYAA